MTVSLHWPVTSVACSHGFALLGDLLSLLVQRKLGKETHPGIRVSLRSTPLLPVPLRRPAYKGRPCPFTPLAASMRLVPLRKAYYQLLLDGKAIPEAVCPPDARSLPELRAGQWCAWRGAIHYRADVGGDPNRMNFALADDEAGLTLLDVHNVVIRGLTLRHFRLDGVNAHDRCRDHE